MSHESSTALDARQSTSNVNEAARQYTDARFRVVPTRAKIACRKGFGAEHPEYTCPPEDFAENEGVAILCGPCPALGSSWLLCTDEDGPFKLEQFVGQLPDTLTSHGGRHRFWSVRPGPKRDALRQWNDVFKTKALGGGALDLKWTGGYACEQGDWEEPGFDPALIAELPEHVLDVILASPCATKASEQVPVTCDGGPDYLRTYGFDPDLVRAWAIEYLAEDANPCVEYQGGDDQLFMTAGALLVGYGLDYNTALELLTAYNEDRCEPPWPADRVEYKLQQISEHGSASFTALELAHRDRFEAHLASEETAADVANDNAKQAVTASAAAANETKNDRIMTRLASLKVIRWGDFKQPMPPINWLCKDLGIAPGRPSLALGKPGSGKTWSVQALAMAVAAGVPAFERFAVRQGRVLHVDLDQGGAATQVRYRQLAVGMGLDLQELPLEIYPFPFKLTDPDAKAMLLRLCTGATFCVVDALRGAIAGDENDSSFVEPLNMLAEVSEATGVVFMTIHHEGKGEGKSGIDLLRGTSALPGALGVVHRYVMGESGVELTELRRAAVDYRPFFTPVHLRLNLSASQHPWLWDAGESEYLHAAKVAWEAPQRAAEDAELTGDPDVRHRVLAIVKEHPGLSKTGVRDKVKAKQTCVYAAIDEMVAQGVLFNAGTDKDCQLYADEPVEIVYNRVPASGGVTQAYLVTKTRLKASQVKGLLDELKVDGRVIRYESEGDTVWMRRAG